MKAADGLKQRHQEERGSQFQNKQEVGFLLVIHEHVVHGVCMCVHVCGAINRSQLYEWCSVIIRVFMGNGGTHQVCQS